MDSAADVDFTVEVVLLMSNMRFILNYIVLALLLLLVSNKKVTNTSPIAMKRKGEAKVETQMVRLIIGREHSSPNEGVEFRFYCVKAHS